MEKSPVAVLGLALLVAGLMAGCSSNPKANHSNANVPTQLDLSEVEVQTSNTQGGLRGVVVDEAIRPIANANVTMVGNELSAVTDSNGVFTFEKLDPGTYFLQVKALRFLASQSSAVVEAGQVSDLRILMTADNTPIPFHETLSFKGFIQASAPLASYSVDIVTADELNQSQCTCLWFFDLGVNTTTLVYEMVWTSSGDPPTGPANLYYQMYEEGQSDIHIQSEYVNSPYLIHLDPEALWGNWTSLRVHFGGSSNWVNVNQAFDAYATLWHNGEAPEGWSVVKGDQ